MLSGKTAVVTGASRGIGRAIAEKLAAEGAFVVINYNGSKEAAETVLAGIRAAGGDGCVMQCNVSDFAACEAWTKEILALYGKIDILVNNAGVNKLAPAEEMPLEVWQKVVGINLTGTFLMCRTFGNRMLQQGHGNIVNVASMSGLVVNPLPQQQCAYNSSKAGVIMLTKVMAMELAKKNITVNCVSPGMIGESIKSTPYTWIGRTGLGEEVADLLLFLSSDDASFITGVDYTIDGGRILGPHGNDL